MAPPILRVLLRWFEGGKQQCSRNDTPAAEQEDLLVHTRLAAALLATQPLAGCGVGEEDSTRTGTLTQDELTGVHSALAAMPGASIVGQHEDGIPHTLEGRLGTAAPSLTGFATADASHAISNALTNIAVTFRPERPRPGGVQGERG